MKRNQNTREYLCLSAEGKSKDHYGMCNLEEKWWFKTRTNWGKHKHHKAQGTEHRTRQCTWRESGVQCAAPNTGRSRSCCRLPRECLRIWSQSQWQARLFQIPSIHHPNQKQNLHPKNWSCSRKYHLRPSPRRKLERTQALSRSKLFWWAN